MDKVKYSVIIPVYQAEKTIARCLDSLLSQSFSDMELIVVNDGSRDQSGAICREYADKHACIRYLEKENGGVSSARNAGLEMASGEYVLFVDSDDYVLERYFETIEAAVNEKKPDLLLFGNYNSKAPGEALNCWDFYADEQGKSTEIVTGLMRANTYNSLCFKVFRRDYIEQYRLRFRKEIEISEDLNFIFSYSTHITSILAIPQVLYYVDEANTDSLSRKGRPDLSNQLLASCLSMVETLESSELPCSLKSDYNDVLAWLYYRSVYSSAKEMIRSNLPAMQRREKLHQICRTYASHSLILREALSWKTRLIQFPVEHKMVRLIDFLARTR